jgi:hypothetical protein
MQVKRNGEQSQWGNVLGWVRQELAGTPLLLLLENAEQSLKFEVRGVLCVRIGLKFDHACLLLLLLPLLLLCWPWGCAGRALCACLMCDVQAWVGANHHNCVTTGGGGRLARCTCMLCTKLELVSGVN